jgi:hypothetical protein
VETKQMQEGADSFVELFRTVEEALSIVGSRTLADLKFNLSSAELETSIATTKTLSTGFEIKCMGLEASGRADTEATHGYKLKLRRRSSGIAALGPTAELAEAIFSIIKATKEISSRTTSYYVDEATVTVDVARSKEGALKIVWGPDAKQSNVCRIILTFTSREG